MFGIFSRALTNQSQEYQGFPAVSELSQEEYNDLWASKSEIDVDYFLFVAKCRNCLEKPQICSLLNRFTGEIFESCCYSNIYSCFTKGVYVIGTLGSIRFGIIDDISTSYDDDRVRDNEKSHLFKSIMQAFVK